MAAHKLNPKQLATLAPGKWFDGRGLYLHVRPGDKRYWRHKVYHEGREVLLAYGRYPEVSLREARDRCEESRTLLRKGINPNQQKREARQAGETFKTVALEYLGTRRDGAAPRTIAKHEWLLGLLSPIHAKPIRRLTGPDILAALKRIEADGRNETAHRASMLIGRVFRYALASGKCDRNPAPNISFALTPVTVRKHPGITDPRKLSELLRAIEAYQGSGISVSSALKVEPYVFLRSSELRCGTWDEVDFTRKLWRIPATRMKMSKEHLVPLAPPVLKILEELHKATGPTGLMFPSMTDKTRPISDMALTVALRRMGITGDVQTVHGFRTTAATLIREREFGTDALIERQLAHRQRNKVQAAYDESQMIKGRREMMIKWADYLDDLRYPEWLQLIATED